MFQIVSIELQECVQPQMSTGKSLMVYRSHGSTSSSVPPNAIVVPAFKISFIDTADANVTVHR